MSVCLLSRLLVRVALFNLLIYDGSLLDIINFIYELNDNLKYFCIVDSFSYFLM